MLKEINFIFEFSNGNLEFEIPKVGWTDPLANITFREDGQLTEGDEVFSQTSFNLIPIHFASVWGPTL